MAVRDNLAQDDSYQLGVNAANDGHLAVNCPFPTGPKRKEWLAGFFSAKQPKMAPRVKPSGKPRPKLSPLARLSPNVRENPIAPAGSDGSKPATFPGVPGPDSKPATDLPTGSESEPVSKSALMAGAAVPGPAGPQSHCEPYREIILAKVQADLSAKRIWQDLAESGATVGYDSVRRFIQRLGRIRSLPFRRMECGPGEEGQVDFGTGAPVVAADGKRRKTNVIRIAPA